MLKVASFDREAPFRIVPEVSQPDLAERLFSSASDPTVCSPEAICREMVSFCALQVLNSSSSLFATHLLSTLPVYWSVLQEWLCFRMLLQPWKWSAIPAIWSQLTLSPKDKFKRKSGFVLLSCSLVNVMPILGFHKGKLR